MIFCNDSIDTLFRDVQACQIENTNCQALEKEFSDLSICWNYRDITSFAAIENLTTTFITMILQSFKPALSSRSLQTSRRVPSARFCIILPKLSFEQWNQSEIKIFPVKAGRRVSRGEGQRISRQRFSCLSFSASFSSSLSFLSYGKNRLISPSRKLSRVSDRRERIARWERRVPSILSLENLFLSSLDESRCCWG